MLESKSSGRSCYFESEEEIKLFKKMFSQYLEKYIEVHKMYISSEGYEVLVRVRTKETLIKHYKVSREKRDKECKREYLAEPWRIISEQIRIFTSIYVKRVNKMRGREGVLVKSRYSRYYFSNVEELKNYIVERESGKELKSQTSERYSVSKRWKRLVDWGRLWRKWGGFSAMGRAFPAFVVEKLIRTTFMAHLI